MKNNSLDGKVPMNWLFCSSSGFSEWLYERQHGVAESTQAGVGEGSAEHVCTE